MNLSSVEACFDTTELVAGPPVFTALSGKMPLLLWFKSMPFGSRNYLCGPLESGSAPLYRGSATSGGPTGYIPPVESGRDGYDFALDLAAYLPLNGQQVVSGLQIHPKLRIGSE